MIRINWATMLAVMVVQALLSASAWGHSTETTAAERPNILFIMTDDHAAHAISAYGSRINKTPHIDRLAREGMRFSNCFVTNSICGPSRAVIMTGKYSHKNGMIDNKTKFDGSQQTVGKLLRAAGYQTALIGKWHLVSDPTGFDYWNILIGQGPYYNPTMIENGMRQRHVGYTTEIITDLALNWLRQRRNREKPFFLMYHHKAPHREWQPGPKHFDHFKDSTIPEPQTLFDDYSGRGKAAKLQAMTVANHLEPLDLKLVAPIGLTAEQQKAWHNAYDAENAAMLKAKPTGSDRVRWNYQRYVKDYLRCVAAVDDNIGRVLDYLDQSGLAKSTVVIYTSDQGFYLGDHGWYDKRWMYEESLRTPLLVRWPGVVRPASVNNDIVLNLDFAETFLEIAGTVIPADMQGRSLVPLLNGRTPPNWRQSMYYRYYEFPGPHNVRQHFGVRTTTHKLMFFPDFDEWELYDLQKDPHELSNAYSEPSNAKLIRELKAELSRLQKLYGDGFKPVPAKSSGDL